jgi:Flp pilus assembly protein TadD
VSSERGPLRTNNVVTVVPDFTTGDCPPPDILVIPGGETAALGGTGPLASFVREQVPKVEIAFSVCNGAFCLAENGFLDGLEATTFHSMTGWLQESAPKAKVRKDVRYVDNGHIVMAAGVSAGIDGALHLIDRLLGRSMARRAASRMEYEWRDDPGGDESIADRVERARRAWYASDWKNALPDYRALATEHPEDVIVLTRLGTCLAFTRQTEEALPLLERAAKLGSTSARLYDVLGFAHSRAGRHADAVAAYRKALELDPDDRGALNGLGSAQFEIGEYAKAIANLRRGLELHVGDDGTHVRIAQAHVLLGDLDGALKALEAVEDREDLLSSSFTDSRFDALRKDPRFVALLERASKK